MMYITNQVIIFSLVVVALTILSVAKDEIKGAPISRSQGHHGRRHNRGHSHGHGRSFPAAPSSKSAAMPTPQYICSSGYQLQDNNTCYREIVTPPKEVCSQGVLIGPGRCVSDTVPAYECPDGNRSKEKSCNIIETAPFLIECPYGSSSCDGGCCITETASVEMVCPLPQINRKHKGGNSSCVRFEEVKPEPYCPNNFELNGNFCFGVQTMPCPSKAVPTPPTKYSTNKLDKKHHKQSTPPTNNCSTSTRFSASYRCPAGSIEHKEKHKGDLTCLMPRTIPLQPVCPLPGGVISLDNLTCQITKTVPPVRRCPSGFNQCSQLMLPQKQGGEECCKQTKSIPKSICSKGQFTDGKCRTYSSPNLVCFGAATLVKGLCVESDTRPALTLSSQKSHKKH